MKYILSIDGGGVRGAFAACFLVELERQLGKPCREIFSMVAGTSTGALIASSIAAGLSATDILAFYQEDAPKVFNLPVWETWPWRLAQGYAYHSANIDAVLRKRFGAAADWCLNDSPIRLLLCGCGVNGHPRYFVQDRPQNAKKTGKLSLVQCATASAAAPTYLDEVYVSPLAGELVGWTVDGGIAGMANPVYRACVEAFIYDDFDPADTRVISLGTGYTKNTAVNPPSGGLVGKLSLVIDALLYNGGRQQTEDAQRHWKDIIQRFNWELSESVDMADAGAIPGLIALGRQLAPKMDWKAVLGL